MRTSSRPGRTAPSRSGIYAAAALAGSLGLLAAACRAPGGPDGGPLPDWDLGGTLDCRRPPRFAAEVGFPAGSALSTGDGDLPGLALVDAVDRGRTFQHETWVRHGHLGPFVLDGAGNVYVAPSPGMDLTLNPPEEQNLILRVDSESGEMAELVRLEPDGPLSADNPFGILGLTFDCDTGSLYASSVAGSSRRSEIGRIARIEPADGRVTDSLSGVDAMGMAVFRGSRERRLYYGSARRPEIWSVSLDQQGAFQGTPRRELLLPGWPETARRIVFDADGSMEVRTVPFVFNLAVGLDTPETTYTFRYDPATDTWLAESSD